MDYLWLGIYAFPVRGGSLCELRDEPGEYRWCLEIHCGGCEALELCSEDGEPHWMAGAEPYLYAQMLPLRVRAPEELVGRTYDFPQSPLDDDPTWGNDGWPFFCLYLCEHDLVHPARLTFLDERGGRYRVQVEATYRDGEERYDLKALAWLDWEPRTGPRPEDEGGSPGA